MSKVTKIPTLLKEVSDGLEESVRLGFVKKKGKDKFRITEQGSRYAEELILNSPEVQEIIRQLDAAHGVNTLDKILRRAMRNSEKNQPDEE